MTTMIMIKVTMMMLMTMMVMMTVWVLSSVVWCSGAAGRPQDGVALRQATQRVLQVSAPPRPHVLMLCY
jgi:hypothetical protein